MTWLPMNLKSDEPVDVFFWHVAPSRPMIEFMGTGLAENIEDLWVKTGYIDKVDKGILQAALWEGEHYGWVTGAHYEGIIYNKNVFEENNWSEPQTYDEFVQLLKDAKEAGSPIGFSGVANSYPNSLLWDMILVSLYEDTWRTNFALGKKGYEADDDKISGAATVLREIAENSYFGAGDDVATMKQMLATGELSMIAEGDWTNGILTGEFQLKAGEDFDMFKFPQINADIPSYVVGPFDGFMVSSTSKNMDAAKAYAEYWMTEECQLLFSAVKKSQSPISTATATEDYLMKKEAEIFKDHVLVTHTLAMIDSAIATDFMDLVSEFIGTDMTADELITRFETAWEKQGQIE